MRERSADGSLPRWVKVLTVIALAIALLALVLQLAGGGEHGPSRHAMVERSDA